MTVTEYKQYDIEFDNCKPYSIHWKVFRDISFYLFTLSLNLSENKRYLGIRSGMIGAKRIEIFNSMSRRISNRDL